MPIKEVNKHLKRIKIIEETAIKNKKWEESKINQNQ
jgi:hypothetical protein